MKLSRKLYIATQAVGTTYRIGMALFTLFYAVKVNTTWDTDLPEKNTVSRFPPRKS